MNHTLRVGSRYGPIFDTQVPDEFNLDSFVQDVRSKGYYFNGVLYMAHETIAFITLIPAHVSDSMANNMGPPQAKTWQ